MDEELRSQLQSHTLAPPSKPAGPYAELEVPATWEALPTDLREKWVLPFYMWRIKQPDEFAAHYAPIRNDVSHKLVSMLLCRVNWRPRLVAAYFAAIENYSQLTEHIGRLLLRSDLCYAGDGYALALSQFNTPESRDFLTKYLDHYLQHPDLDFDQDEVVAAVAHLDRQNGTDLIGEFQSRFPGTKGRLVHALAPFEFKMNAIERIRSALEA